ncbi:MAG: 23S rRNA (adenine(2503)-C(2))-methyltransferase RlmN [Deltaproteobacteria bacterium]|nr:23S rRNA (adenine(2503)-C(2))-methyltransferase RlmN [Deltaproteobacteria bacterium]MBW2360173.1 23S rRNA (adenine(2503)-C(2))-methyltransferase RlmN [Deltaproteobacteria bacterium]
MSLPCLKDHSIDSLRERFQASGIERWRAEQVAGWLYARGVESFDEMTDLSRELRVQLAEQWSLRALEIDAVQRSLDGTLKAALRTRDGARLESVLIPEEARNTLCVSTQVGCPLACSFCATGALGFTRNLTAGEIVDQVCRMREVLGGAAEITNLVFMGMGEPLLNLANLTEAIRLLVHPKAFGLAPRRVTVSTVGVVPQIEELLSVAPIHLAVSLHATTDEVRDVLVPINRQFPLDVLLGELRRLEGVNKRRPVFFEYTLIDGLNDSLEDARRLAPLLHGIPAKVNLIPMNAHDDSEYRAPSPARIDGFLRAVAASGLRVTLRRSRGPDIQAACGQLALRGGHDHAA